MQSSQMNYVNMNDSEADICRPTLCQTQLYRTNLTDDDSDGTTQGGNNWVCEVILNLTQTLTIADSDSSSDLDLDLDLDRNPWSLR